jgi:hypothetical protein
MSIKRPAKGMTPRALSWITVGDIYNRAGVISPKFHLTSVGGGRIVNDENLAPR